MVTAYLALGANLGNRRASLAGARRALANKPGIRVVAKSCLYETDPVGGPPDQKQFLNAVLKIETELEADRLLETCLEVEKQFGRRRVGHWGPRTLDVDLLFYGSEVFSKKQLTVPHPRLHERAFVLAPLLDVAPGLRHPVLNRTINELYRQLPSSRGVERLCDSW
ncbi:MAG: 2-amino-4-hydroxy-6-hydroxymethyldihydropteridine diphosphokinase [Syntrophotaleaceae bacterium]